MSLAQIIPELVESMVSSRIELDLFREKTFAALVELTISNPTIKENLELILDNYDQFLINARQAITSLLVDNQNLKEEISIFKLKTVVPTQHYKVINSASLNITPNPKYLQLSRSTSNILKSSDLNSSLLDDKPIPEIKQTRVALMPAKQQQKAESPQLLKGGKVPLRIEIKTSAVSKKECESPYIPQLTFKESYNEPQRNSFSDDAEAQAISSDSVQKLIRDLMDNPDLRQFFSNKYGEGSFNNFIYKLKKNQVTLEMIDSDLAFIIEYKSKQEEQNSTIKSNSRQKSPKNISNTGREYSSNHSRPLFEDVAVSSEHFYGGKINSRKQKNRQSAAIKQKKSQTKYN